MPAVKFAKVKRAWTPVEGALNFLKEPLILLCEGSLKILLPLGGTNSKNHNVLFFVLLLNTLKQVLQNLLLWSS